jgi:hypothetical protein
MYNDSLDAYHESLSTIKSFGVPMGAMGNSITEPYDIPQASSHNPHTNDLIFNVPSLGNMVVHTDDSARYKGQPYIKNHNIEPSVYLEGRGGTMGINLFTKPKQPVEYQPRPSYQQIPTKTPTVSPIQQSIDDELRTSFIEPTITYPKDVQRFTAGDYLESQDKSSGYVNFGKGEGRKDLYENGGIVNNEQVQGKTIDAFYTPKKAKSMGTNRSYPYRTLENPSYEDININPPQYHDPSVIREMRIERRLTPSNIHDNSTFNQINNNDIGFLFNESFGIQ